MRTFAAAILLLIVSATAVRAQSPRLLVIPRETSIKSHATVAFDVFVYNDSGKPAKIPPIELFSAVYSVRDTKTNSFLRAESSAKTASHAPSRHSLASKAVEHRRIEMKVPAEPGELIEMYLEIGRDSILRSNSVLLYCPVEAPVSQPASSPKSAITP